MSYPIEGQLTASSYYSLSKHLCEKIIMTFIKLESEKMSKNKLTIVKEIQLDVLPKDKIRVILDGDKMRTKNEFLDVVGQAFSFPSSCQDNIDGFMDYIRDLGWGRFESCKKIELIITNQEHFLESDPQMRQLTMDNLWKDVLFYWEEEVLIDTIGAVCKEFNIFLVDNIK